MLEGRGLQAEVKEIRYTTGVSDEGDSIDESDSEVYVNYYLEVDGWDSIDHAEIKVLLDDEGIDITVLKGGPPDRGEIISKKENSFRDILLEAIADDMVTRVKTGD